MSEIIPIFVINLKRSTERRINIERQLQTIGINYEIIEATDGSKLSEDDLKTIYDSESSFKNLKYHITKNEVACADSHLRIYEHIVKEKISYALILEDDVILDSRIKEVINYNFLSKHKFDWLQIDYARVGWPFIKSWLRASWHNTKKNPLFILYAIVKSPLIIILSLFEWLRQESNNQIRVVRFFRPIYLTGAYVITLNSASDLIKFGRPIKFPSDMLPNKKIKSSNFKMVAICPPLAHQELSFGSEIGAR